MSLAPQINEKTVLEVRNIAISFKNILDDGELLSGTPLITEVTSSDLTITNRSINTSALTINGISNAIGEVVQCSVSGGFIGKYKITITVATNSVPSQTLKGTIRLHIVNDNS